MSERRGTPRYGLAAAGIVLLAFALRMYRFAELPPGLFFDEAYNALDGLAVLNDGIRPVFFAANNGREPFYIYLQSIFLLQGSTAPFIVRLPSVFLGTLTVALTYPLVRRLLADEVAGRREMVALLATFLIATTQWHLNFSRMGFRAIAQPLFEALAFYLFYRAAAAAARSVSGRRSLWWLWFLLSGVVLGGALYTYLSARLLPPAAVAVILAAALWGQRWTRRYVAGLGLLAVGATAVAMPLGVYYLRHPDMFIGHSKDVSLLSFGGTALLLENALRLAGMFNLAGDVNWRHNLPGRPVFDPLIGLFFLIGLAVVVSRLRRGWRRESSTPNGYLLPVILVPVMLLPSLLSEGAPHFLRAVGALPFVVLFPALGIEAAWCLLRRHRALASAHGRRAASAGLVVVLVFAMGASYKGYFLDWGGAPDPYYHFDGSYLEFAGYVRAQSPSERVYLSPWLANHATARLYLRGRPYESFDSERTIVLTSRDALYAFQEGGVDRQVAAAFPRQMPFALEAAPLRDRYDRPAFGFYRLPASSSPVGDGFLEKWGPRLGPLVPPAGAAAGATVSFATLAATPGSDDLTLIGVAFEVPRGLDAEGEAVSGGITVPVTLAWRESRALAEDYTASLRLVDKNGRRWTQSDSLAGGPSYPTGKWTVEEIVLDRTPLLLPADLPPGEYQLELVVYALGGKRTMEVRVAGRPQGEAIALGKLRVAGPAPGALAAMRPRTSLEAPMGAGLALLGYSLGRDTMKPGETADLDLFWKVEQGPARDLAVAIRLLDAREQVVAERLIPPLWGDYPTSRWQAGDALRDPYRIAVGAQAAPGKSSLAVALVDPSSGARIGEIKLAGPEIVDRARVFTPPSPRYAASAKFGGQIELVGFASGQAPAASPPVIGAAAGATLPVTLFWRSAAIMDTSYTVFVQLLNPRGQLVAQHDGLPQGGAAPTTSWLPGEFVDDPHELSLRRDLPPGDYTLIAGLYNAVDGKRLPVGEGDFVRLATVAIKGG